MKVAIIGAGAGGLMCAGLLFQRGFEVTLFDKNEKSGKKLYITGKGKCNFTNASIGDEFVNNIVRGKKFLLSSLSRWNSFDTMDFFSNLGVDYKIERGGRVFPQSDKSSDIIKALNEHSSGCEFRYKEKVVAVYDKDGQFFVVSEKGKYVFDRVVIATGGKSYPATGSEGDGYKFAQRFGHMITPIKPALVPIMLEDDFVKDLQGISLKNVTLKCIADGRKLNNFGEMLFTDKGISGPIVLSLSSQVNRASKIDLAIDFKPALDEEKLDERLLRDFNNNKNRMICNVLKLLLPHAIIPSFLKKCDIDGAKKVNSISSEERKTIINTLKNFGLTFKDFYPIDFGIITSGGVDLSQINPKSMESKLVKGLYFVGEVLDMDAFTGGFNLQLAFTTAHACGENLE